MSLTQAENEQWRLEINRLNAQGWAEYKRDQVHAIQAANPGMSFETAWSKAEREQQNPAPEPTTIGEAAKLVKSQHPTWTFEQSWSYAEVVFPNLVKSSTTGSNGVTAKPFHQVEAAARVLMAADPLLPFSVALVRARGEMSRPEIRAVEPKPKGRTMLIRGSEGIYLD